MFGSFIRESPLLSAIIAAVAAILVSVFASAMVSGWRNRRNTAMIRREPVLDRRHGDSREPDRGYLLAGDQHWAAGPGRRFGFAALAVSFVLGGLVVGAAGLASSSSGQFVSAFHSLVGLVDPRASDAREAPGLESFVTAGTNAETSASTPAGPDPQPGSPSSDDPSGDVKLRLAAFAENLKKELPKDAGPEISLTSVAVNGNTLSLAYAVGKTMNNDEIAAFDAYVMRTIKSLFCGKEAREIRFLNESGIAFHMVYADPSGQTVAKLTVPPHFCA
jgi:hypothetical protein